MWLLLVPPRLQIVAKLVWLFPGWFLWDIARRMHWGSAEDDLDPLRYETPMGENYLV